MVKEGAGMDVDLQDDETNSGSTWRLKQQVRTKTECRASVRLGLCLDSEAFMYQSFLFERNGENKYPNLPFQFFDFGLLVSPSGSSDPFQLTGPRRLYP